MVGRIKKDDQSVPYFENEYFYYSRYEKKKEYPIYCRKYQKLDNNEKFAPKKINFYCKDINR